MAGHLQADEVTKTRQNTKTSPPDKIKQPPDKIKKKPPDKIQKPTHLTKYKNPDPPDKRKENIVFLLYLNCRSYTYVHLIVHFTIY